MRRILFMGLDAALAAVFLVPLFLFLNKRYYHSRKKTCFYLLLAAYLSGVYAVVGLPTVNYVRFDPNLNLIPFRYMFSDFTNSFLNVLLFLPLGAALPLFWKRYRAFSHTVLFGFAVSLLIELLQIFTFRATDVNDLITNTTGTTVGWCLARMITRRVPKAAQDWEHRELYGVCTAAFSVMFFLQPFLEKMIIPFLF